MESQISESIQDLTQVVNQVIQLLQPSWSIQGWSDISAIATAASALASFLMAFLTYRYVKVSQEMLREMATTRKENTRPYVIIDIEIDQHSDILLVIRNIGDIVARNVEIKWNPDIIDALGDNSTGNLTSISTMIPGWEYKTYIDTCGNEFRPTDQKYITIVNVNYEDHRGCQYSDSFRLGIDIYDMRKHAVH